ncbi:diaminobutyrate acetyltransferase [Teredinibacter sp. KSP-S5-2]|uniref:diaminobutyrate acetyltransferase n=1 Tax=Teredinibacter sp. KSP-S5-2 TaxID=3034506 RepID=UPI002934423D|nr:diaminobutyrate acetyltransferase [Teredinibacter sp. KSP-S5-2]WNO11684.1 diaminobutyrate acetyltransferase [Teredinibacter sp. KSP-S5-2]
MPESIALRKPTPSDGKSVYDLVKQCPPLDINSMYCNLLQATHFSATSVAAELKGKMVGFVSGYIVPEKPNVLFVWQVAVAEEARGRGLAKSMIFHILDRAETRQVDTIQTTITADNGPSRSLFKRLSKELEAPLNEYEMFDRDKHFGGTHDSEFLIEIASFRRV